MALQIQMATLGKMLDAYLTVALAWQIQLAELGKMLQPYASSILFLQSFKMAVLIEGFRSSNRYTQVT